MGIPAPTINTMPLFSELRRRNVFKVAYVYVVATALIMWLAYVVRAQLGLPEWVVYVVAGLLVIGFPVALIFAWVYEITPVGLMKAVEVDQTQSIVFKTGQKLNAALAVLVVLAAVAMIANRLLPELVRPDLTPLQAVTKRVTVGAMPEGALVAPTAENVPPEIRSFTLANGLKIIVWPDHDIPNVVMYNFVRAGGRNEYPGITGLSHFFEHMMFLGSESVPPGDFDNIMEAAGGTNNAYTSSDVTVYMDWFPRSALNTIFAIEADRIGNLKIDPAVVDSEREVVYSERRSGYEDDNWGRLYLQMKATTFVAHPYQFPVIGWPSDIESWTQADLENFFRTYYAPNNLTMVFTGDVTPEEVYAYARTYFGGIPAQAPPPEIRTVEPEQQGMRRVTLEAPAQAPLLQMAFHAGDAQAPDTLPLSLLMDILISGDSSRLNQLLVNETAVAIDVGGWLDQGFDPGMAFFYITVTPGTDPADVEAMIFDVFDDVATNGVTAAELDKARNISLADHWRELATIDGKASLLGDFEVFYGGYENAFSLADRVGNVTADELRAVAARVFRRTNATVGTLVPTAGGGDE